MKKVIFLFIVTLSFFNCARKGSPSGGPKDEKAPVFVTANPPYKSLNFNKKNIKIYFDEYIVLKDLQKQLIISPPLKNQPIITPQGTPSKYINIKILDTLSPNTTYTFNFGSAIQDNNENNKLESFKYVFSTGDKIDSLNLKGSIKDAFDEKVTKGTSLLLYKVNETFNDSIIYKKRPHYVAKSQDSVNFEFANLKQGKYLLIALQETQNDYIYNAKNDKIGFYSKYIELPKDSIISEPIELFKEKIPFKFKRGKEVSKGKIQFRYTGEKEDMKVKVLSTIKTDFKSYSKFVNDTLNYWFTPFNTDSLVFEVSNKQVLDTVTVALHKKKIDSLNIHSSVNNDILHLHDTLFIKSNNPINKVAIDKVTLLDKDSLGVKVELKKKDDLTYALLFEKKQNMSYQLAILPSAFTDLYGGNNKKKKLSFQTQSTEDYGSIKLKVITDKPVIIQLLAQNGDIARTAIFKHTNEKEFLLLNPDKYKIRAIVDKNNDNIWNTGSFLSKKQPEKVIYFNKTIPLRANWSVNETFSIK